MNYQWIVSGDINEFMYSFEKVGDLVREEKRMETFKEVLDECQLADLGFYGQWFTWERGNLPELNITERLDKRVANEKWFDLFPTYQIHHLQHSYFDLCSLLLNT